MGIYEAKHGGNIYEVIRNGKNPEQILDFSANINPLGLSKNVKESLYSNIQGVIHYPDPDAVELKAAISSSYSLAFEEITVGNGVVELIYLICHLLKPKQVLIPIPTFSEYERAAQACKASIRYHVLHSNTDFALSLADLATELAGTDMVFICNPNNPTGKLCYKEDFLPLLDQALKTNTIVVVDESFLDFLPDSESYSCKSLLKKYCNLIILHSLTKFYAIPGLRLGFAAASPSITAALHLSKDPWNVNSLAQAAGVAGLNDTQYQQLSQKVVQQAKNELFQLLGTVPKFKPYFPSVNYIFVNIENSQYKSLELKQALAKHNILIRDCSNYPGLTEDFIRVAVKLPKENSILIENLLAITGKTSKGASLQ